MNGDGAGATAVNCPTYDAPSPGWGTIEAVARTRADANTVPVATTLGPCQCGGIAVATRSGEETALNGASTLHSEARVWANAHAVAAGVVVANGRVPYADGVAVALQIAGPATVTYPAEELAREHGGPLQYGTRLYVLPEQAPFYVRHDPHASRRWKLTTKRSNLAVFVGHLLDIDPRQSSATVVVYLSPIHTEHYTPEPLGPAAAAPAPTPDDPLRFPPGPASHLAIRKILRCILTTWRLESDMAGLNVSLD